MWYRHEAVIEVSGPFPIDMLRYDQCYPDHGTDSRSIEDSRIPGRDNKPYRITVEAISEKKRGEHWTVARWESFGARVVETATLRQ